MSIFLKNIKIHKTFNSFFNKQEIVAELERIEEKLLNGKKYDNTFYPLPKDVLRFATIDLLKVKCVILGMDPYPSDFIKGGKIVPVATGRSFEVKNVLSWQDNFKQTSLQNILKTLYLNHEQANHKGKGFDSNDGDKRKYHKVYKENVTILYIRKEILENRFKILEPPALFDSLEKQGVMFLNATLTVKPHLSNSHTKYWTYFIDELIKYMINYKKDKNKNPIKWLSWGQNAKDRIKDLVDEKDIIYTCHPAARANNTFIKDNCFQYIKDINWTGQI